MTNDLPQAPIVMTAVELGIELLEMGAAEEALENFKTAVRLNEPFVSELLSDDQKVAKQAAARRLPPGTDLLTYTTSPLCQLYRLLRLRGDAQAALWVGQEALAIFMQLESDSAEAVECLDEVGDIAYQVGDHEFANRCSELARAIRQVIAQTDT